MFLGIQFSFNDNIIRMDQSHYIQKLLVRFGLEDCKPKLVPCDLSTSKNDFADSELLDDFSIYREIVGSLIYVMTGTRPDLSYVVTKLAQHMSKPNIACLLYTSPSPRDKRQSRMPSSA